MSCLQEAAGKFNITYDAAQEHRATTFFHGCACCTREFVKTRHRRVLAELRGDPTEVGGGRSDVSARKQSLEWCNMKETVGWRVLHHKTFIMLREHVHIYTVGGGEMAAALYFGLRS